MGFERDLGEGLKVELEQVADAHVSIGPHIQAQLRRHVPQHPRPVTESRGRQRAARRTQDATATERGSSATRGGQALQEAAEGVDAVAPVSASAAAAAAPPPATAARLRGSEGSGPGVVAARGG